MRNLIQLTDTDDFQENGWMNLIQTKLEDGNISLLFAVRDGSEQNRKSKWSVSAANVLDYKIFEAYDCGMNYHVKDHVMLNQFTSKTGNLFFRGAHSPAESVVGALYQKHIEIAQDWIEFEKYLNSELKLTDLIKSNHGLIAKGPQFLLVAYQKVLESFNINTSLSDLTPPKRWNGTAWIEITSKPEMIHFGGSYVVADFFQAEECT